MPEVGISVGLGLLHTIMSRVGFEKVVRKWPQAHVEAMGKAYLFAVEENWDELDRNHAHRLLHEAFARLTRNERGEAGDPFKVPLDAKLELALRGLGSDAG
jgi:hypothetical protein